jgi:hypothetical protein
MGVMQNDELLSSLKMRFNNNMMRHPTLDWDTIQARVASSEQKLKVLRNMEHSGGEPDVIDFDQQTNEYLFCDCSAESPIGRRSLCFDLSAWHARKANKPSGNVIDIAESLGVELLTEQQYRHLQTLGKFDTKTSSWIQTPSNIRQLGGALFCDRRYEQVFVYHNGAESYYAARGFRGSLKV